MMFGGTRVLFEGVLNPSYEQRDVLLSMQILAEPVEAIVRREASPPAPPTERAGSTLERIHERGALRVGYVVDGLPFAFFNGRDELVGSGVAPYGISRDSTWSHVAWQQALDLEVPLLSDWTGEAVRELGIVQEFRGLPDVARRAAFVVGEDGIIRGAWRYGASEVSDFDMLVESARSLS